MTAVPPRPAAPDLPYPLGRHCCGAPDATACHQRGLCWMEGVHPDSPGYTPAAPDATAGDELREAMERLIHDGIVRQWRGSMREDVALTDPRPIVRDLLAGPLRDVLAERDRLRETVQRVRAVQVRTYNARAHAAAFDRPDEARAYDDAGEWIRRALDGTS